MTIFGYITVALVGYLLGSIPTGYLVAKAHGLDIRKLGSGNIGATNVFRSVGKMLGVFVFVVDALKGYVACAWVGALVIKLWPATSLDSVQQSLPIIAGVAAILGHNYTCWLGFKGGKGIATSAGVLLSLFPKALLVVLGIWLVVFALGRYVSLASIVAAFWLPILVWVFGYNQHCVLIAIVLSAMAIYRHKSNIKRLIAGTENRFGQKKSDVPQSPLPPT